jgi:leucyl/phenylalanyl-tRNA--protein transferase
LPYFELSKDELTFPPAYFADLDGLVAVGGEISSERILLAYSSGLYYWHFPLKHIKWWSPDPRTVLLLNAFELNENRLEVLLSQYKVTFNTEFEQSLRLCQHVHNIKESMNNDWLSERAFRVFMELHKKGFAHSVEIWMDHQLVGGLFGVAIGTLFFGEYIFSIAEHADELAVLSLIKKLRERDFELIDMQKPTVFLEGIEYDELSRIEYVSICKENKEKHIKIITL